MFSLRFVAAAILLATVTALPTTEKLYPEPDTAVAFGDIDDTPWFTFPIFGNFFAPLWRLFPKFTEIGPKVVVNDKEFQVVISAKGFKKEDFKVKVKGDFIFVQGSHESKKDDHDIFATQFFHTYTLPVNASGADVTAELTSDDFLVVTAPLNGPGEKDKEVDREVLVVESGKPYAKEEKTENTETHQVVPEADDRKEPTTPPNKETSENISPDKENSIPHGSETLQ